MFSRRSFTRTVWKGLDRTRLVSSCLNCNPRIIKTIRLRRPMLKYWIKDTNVKVIHLVRDPRAMYSSMAKRPGVWSDVLNDFQSQCRRIRKDMLLELDLPRER